MESSTNTLEVYLRDLCAPHDPDNVNIFINSLHDVQIFQYLLKSAEKC